MAYRGTGLVPFFGSNFPISSLRREIDRLFEDAGGASGGRWLPAADVREDDDAIDIDIELACIDPENVDINVENGILTVSGEKRTEQKEGKEGQYHSVERRYGSFVRSFQLPQGVDESKISVENARWGPIIKFGKKTIALPKKADGSRFTPEEAATLTLEQVQKFIEAEIPGAFTKKAKTAKKSTAKKSVTGKRRTSSTASKDSANP